MTDSSQAQTEIPLIPVRMLNEYVYCPRLAYMEWVQGEWADSADTVAGTWAHRRVDQPGRTRTPDKDKKNEKKEVITTRSVHLGSENLGLTAKIDLLEESGAEAAPVDYKKGKRPHISKGAWDPERVQLCAQGLLLQEHGFSCKEGILYFAGSRERVRVAFDEELIRLTKQSIRELKALSGSEIPPPPLHDSPKCMKCSLAGICLPDEIRHLSEGDAKPRPILPKCEEALPLHVQESGARIKKKGGVLEIWLEEEKLTEARIREMSHLALYGPVHVTAPVVHELMRRGIGISYHSFGGWFMGYTTGIAHKNVELRTAQYKKSFDNQACLMLAKSLVAAKIANCRTLLRRNWREENLNPPLAELNSNKHQADGAKSLQILLGMEGSAAGRYFRAFPGMLTAAANTDLAYDFTARNRRPPKDPVNALLGFAYALLSREWTTTLTIVGFDPYRGFYHQPRFGRPALALDMMEPFRPLVADSIVITAVNNGEICRKDFFISQFGCSLSGAGRKRFIEIYERRMAQEVTHPIFGYRISYRRLFEVQARLLGRFLFGEISEYPCFLTR
ncbi:MAG: CRISPR-associated endonuclease Cas1 [Desulfosalsimonadaceae bacterium]